jgi:hypothetical protein
MILHRSKEMPAAADGAAGPTAARWPVRRVTAVMLLAAAVLDLTRCGLVVGTVTQAGPAAGSVSAGLAAAAASFWTARGCQRGARWSGWAAFLIGTASGPQAAASGFHAVYTIPDIATAVLGVLVGAGVLATAGRSERPELPGVPADHSPPHMPCPACRLAGRSIAMRTHQPSPGGQAPTVTWRHWLLPPGGQP